jgi:Flp pilus assembly pilin Flp
MAQCNPCFGISTQSDVDRSVCGEPGLVKPAVLPRNRVNLTDLLSNLSGLRRLGTETLGQDLIEYALMAGFVAVAAGAIFPTNLMPAVSGIFSKLGSYFAIAASGPTG